jgi:RimJ/RimL family protein N-acetyltransferase
VIVEDRARALPAVVIRPYRSEDAAALYAAARESIDEVFPWLPWCHPAYSLDEARDWIASRPQARAEGIEYAFAIVDARGRYLGGCGINMINRIHRFANLGYWVRSSEAGRGVAPAAIRQAAAFAFGSTDLVRLEILCAVGNSRSQRAAERAGATREAVLRDRLILHGQPVDAVMYSMVRSDWFRGSGVPGLATLNLGTPRAG